MSKTETFLQNRADLAQAVSAEYGDRVTSVQIKFRDCDDVSNFLRKKKEFEEESSKRSIEFD